METPENHKVSLGFLVYMMRVQSIFRDYYIKFYDYEPMPGPKISQAEGGNAHAR